MTDERIIGEIKDYDSFTACLRRWIKQVGTTYADIDAIAGLPSNYLSKLISTTPVRSFSRMSLGSTLQAMGLKLLVAIDHEQLEAMKPRYTVSKRPASESMPATKLPVKPRKLHNPLVGNPGLAALYAHRRAVMLTPQRRRALARHAAKIRWQRERAKDAAPSL
jgi:hypothetical protein